MEDFNMGERRLDDRRNVCDLHSGFHEAIARIEKSQENNTILLNAIAGRQFEYIERQIKIESIVTNGLSSNVAAIKKQLEDFCGEVKKRLDVLESFSWFRIWMNQLRDNLLKYILLAALTGGGLFFVIYRGKDILKGLLG